MKKTIKQSTVKTDVAKQHSSLSHMIMLFLLLVAILISSYTFFELKNDMENLSQQLSGLNRKPDGAHKQCLHEQKAAQTQAVESPQVNAEYLKTLEKDAQKLVALKLVKAITESVDNTADYSAKLASLQKLYPESFKEEFAELKSYEKMAIMPYDKIEALFKKSTTTMDSEAPKTFGERLSNIVRVTSKDDDRARITNETLLSMNDFLKERDEIGALYILKQMNSKNESLKKLDENLNVRSDLKFYLKNISEGVLSHD